MSCVFIIARVNLRRKKNFEPYVEVCHKLYWNFVPEL